MNRIQRLIYQETFPPTIITLLVLTFVVFTREFGRFTELLIRQNADFSTVLKAVLYLFPSILIFTVPFAFLIGTLIGFSHLSSESEIVALKAGGVGILQMLRPVLKIGLLVLSLTVVLTLWVLPWGNWQLRELQYQLRSLPIQFQVKPRVFYEEFPGMLLYVNDVDLQSGLWKGILLSDRSEAEERLIVADSGYVALSSSENRLQLHFEDGTIYKAPTGSPERDSLSAFGTLDIPLQLPNSEIGKTHKRSEDMTLRELLYNIENPRKGDYLRSLAELHRRIALPISALIFSVMGVTFGIRSHRGGRGYGFLVSMIVAFSYYILFATGSKLAEDGVLPLILGVWGANIFFFSLALLSLRYARLDSGVLHALSNRSLVVTLGGWWRGMIKSTRNFTRGATSHLKRQARTGPSLRFRVARIIDLYIMLTFSRFLAITAVISISLFYLFTFFEMVDDFLSYRAPYKMIASYFFYLLPHVMMLLVPISVLIATLITFGTMEKTSQLAAFKSCGVSIYRLALPVFFLGLAVSVVIFGMQEYVLPPANQQQDTLRNLIKGSPIQTTQPGRHWIFGEGNHLYSYDHFIPETQLLAQVSIFDLDVKENRLNQHIFAQRAKWDPPTGAWQLENGWSRDLQEGSFERFDTRSVQLAEHPEYFNEEVKESSKMTYGELREYIADLQLGGFEVDHLQTELYKKLSFPTVSLIMTFLGLPFALTVGKKGALYGVGAGVLIGIIYWGLFGIFDVFGSSGLLAPVLAAWGPNIVFGAGAGLLVSWLRT